MRNIHTTLLLFFSLTFAVIPDELENKKYEFIRRNSYYSFQTSFMVEAEFDCLLEIVYKLEHIRHYTAGAESVEMIREDENGYEVMYTYRKFLFKTRSTWQRTLDRDQGKVVFKMIANRNNLKLLPDIIDSSGYYHISAVEDGFFQIAYFQECTLEPGILNKSYIRQAEIGAEQFLIEFKDYIKKMCQSDTHQ